MSDKTLKNIVRALVGLVLLWGVLEGVDLLRAGSGGPEGDGALAALFEEVAPDALETIAFEGPAVGELLRLEKGGAAWSVNGHPADSNYVASFLRELGEVVVGDVLSSNPANHDRMGVSEDSATTVTLEGAGSTHELLLGSAGPSFGTVFARLPGESEVRLLTADLRSPATRTLDQWRSKRMLALDTAAVATVAVQRDGESYELVRSDSTWMVGGEPADSATVALMIREFASLLASGFAEGETVEGEPARSVEVRSAGGESLATIRLWDPPEGAVSNLSARAEGQVTEAGAVYAMPSWRADRITPERSRVVPEGGGE